MILCCLRNTFHLTTMLLFLYLSRLNFLFPEKTVKKESRLREEREERLDL